MRGREGRGGEESLNIDNIQRHWQHLVLLNSILGDSGFLPSAPPKLAKLVLGCFR